MTQIKVLVAEDDMNIRLGLVDTLESEGYRVSQAKVANRPCNCLKIIPLTWFSWIS